MTENDKKAKVGDCHFLLLTKFPSGHIHIVDISSRELKDYVGKRGNLQVFGDKIEHITFEPIL